MTLKVLINFMALSPKCLVGYVRIVKERILHGIAPNMGNHFFTDLPRFPSFTKPQSKPREAALGCSESTRFWNTALALSVSISCESTRSPQCLPATQGYFSDFFFLPPHRNEYFMPVPCSKWSLQYFPLSPGSLWKSWHSCHRGC